MLELKETFIKRHKVERISNAEIRPEERSEKAGSCRGNLWNEIQFNEPKGHKQTQEQNKRSVHGLQPMVADFCTISNSTCNFVEDYLQLKCTFLYNVEDYLQLKCTLCSCGNR